MLTALIKLIRPYYSLPLTLGYIIIVSYLTACNLTPIRQPLIFASCSLLLAMSGAYALNDLCDIGIDLINAPYRPLPAGELSRKTALTIAIIFFAASLTCAIFVSARFFLTITAVIAALVFYDIYSKRLGFLKPVCVALIASSLYPLAFALTPRADIPHTKALYIFQIWFFVIATAFEIYKDIRDIKGDSQIATQHCPIQTAQTLTVLSVLIAPLPALFGYCGQMYLIASIVAGALTIPAASTGPILAIKLIYANVLLITVASWVDLLMVTL